MYLTADTAQVDANGTLLFTGHSAKDRSKTFLVLAFAAGHWNAFYAASVLDGSAIAVDHWEGEVKRD